MLTPHQKAIHYMALVVHFNTILIPQQTICAPVLIHLPLRSFRTIGKLDQSLPLEDRATFLLQLNDANNLAFNSYYKRFIEMLFEGRRGEASSDGPTRKHLLSRSIGLIEVTYFYHLSSSQLAADC